MIKTKKSENNKDFDSVKWVRQIRNEFYEKHKHLSAEKYYDLLKKSSKKAVEEMFSKK